MTFAQVLAGRVFQGESTNNDDQLFLPGVSNMNSCTATPGLSSLIHVVYDALV